MNFKLCICLAFAFVCVLSGTAIGRELAAKTYSCVNVGKNSRWSIKIDNNSKLASFYDGKMEVKLPGVELQTGNKHYYSFEGLTPDATSRMKIEYNRKRQEARLTLDLGTSSEKEYRTSNCQINNHISLRN